ncbi:unnamed protein product [Caenorhabditis brenneri]
MAPKSNEATVRKLMKQVVDGNNIVPAIKTLATFDISLELATDLQIAEILATHSGSPLLSGPIHEILKKLEGKKGKENGKRRSIKRVSMSGNGSKKRRSSGVVKKVVEKKEEVEDGMKTPTRLFKRKESTKKDSAMWKKMGKVVG